MSNKLIKNNKPAEKKTKLNKGMAAAVGCIVIVVLALVIFFAWKGKSSTGDTVSEDTAAETEAAEESQTADESEESDVSEASAEPESSESSEVSGPVATISVEDYGDIVVQLDEDAAPLTVANFVALAEEGFYDGLTFHRIIDGFMIQGGDPLGNGTGGSDETIKGEFSSNGVDNPISHERGVISMARSNDSDSASSQFFIVQADSTYLDGEYAAFGYVTSGMDIVDQICEDVPVQDDNGTVNAEDQPVIEKIVITEE